MTMKKRIFIIAAAIILMLVLVSCSVPTQTHDAGDVSLELPIHYVSMDEIITGNATVQELLAEYVPEDVSIDAHFYASALDMTMIAVSSVAMEGEKMEGSVEEFVEEICKGMGGDAEVVEMGGTFGAKYTLDAVFGAEQIPEALQGLTVVSLYYYGDDGFTVVNIICSEDKYAEGNVHSIADCIVAK